MIDQYRLQEKRYGVGTKITRYIADVKGSAFGMGSGVFKRLCGGRVITLGKHAVFYRPLLWRGRVEIT